MHKINSLSQSRSNNSATFLNSINSVNTNIEDLELYELACLSGVHMDSRVFK